MFFNGRGLSITGSLQNNCVIVFYNDSCLICIEVYVMFLGCSELSCYYWVVVWLFLRVVCLGLDGDMF